MGAWWQALSAFEQVFFCIAFPASAILLIQTILTFVGLGDDGGSEGALDAGGDADIEIEGDTDLDDVDHDMDSGADFRFFSIRGLVAFFTLFGWVGALLGAGPMNKVLAVAIAVASGLAAMFLIALIFYGVSRLQSSGNIHYANAVGRTAEVYLTIPASRKGAGKVQVVIQERLIEVNAMTDLKKPIPTGANVKVTGILGDHVLLVEPL
jgi:membrane protein implicated in regulation of membrane protease activity